MHKCWWLYRICTRCEKRLTEPDETLCEQCYWDMDAEDDE